MRKTKRVAALLLAGTLLVGTAGCAGKEEAAPVIETVETAPVVRYTAKPEILRKTETVYVNLDNSGKKQSVSITDWLHTDKGEVAVQDVSDLDKITDIKGNCTPEQDGRNLTWHMTETDLYYTGTTDKQLPVEFAITYRLDGKKMSAKQIAGKSGEAEITVKMKNVCEKDGVYLPVIAAGLMILPENVFAGIEVSNGLSVGDGTKQIVVGMGVPGMADSLGLRDDAKLGSISLGESFTVRAHVENFELGNLYFAVLPICSMDMETLLPGSNAEAAAFFDEVSNVLQSLGQMDIGKLTAALTGESVESLASLLGEAVTTYKKNEALLRVLSKYMTSENIENISAFLQALQDPETMKLLEKLNNPVVKKLLSASPDLLTSIEAMRPMLEELQADLQSPDVQEALNEIPQTMQTLKKMQKALEDNKELLDAFAEIADSDLFLALSAAASENDVQTVLGDLTENADALLPKLQKYITFGKSYGLFTDAAEGTQTSLLFIYMTPSLHSEVKAVEPVTEPPKPWYRKLF